MAELFMEGIMQKWIKDIDAHQQRVAFILLKFGEVLGSSRDELRQLFVIGLNFDNGMKALSVDIINKTGDLTPDEFEHIELHVKYSVENIKMEEKAIVQAIGDHHENYDGTGYPNSALGQEISVFGRMLRIADSYDGLRTKSVYKAGYSHERTLEIMTSENGVYDPDLFQKFKALSKMFSAYEMKEFSVVDCIN